MKHAAFLHFAALIATILTSAPALADEKGGLDPATILNPPADSWPTYSGDYSGKRYSKLDQINQSNVKNLKLAWTAKLTADLGDAASESGAPSAPTFVGGATETDAVRKANVRLRGSILAVNGVLYVSMPDHVWAVDAHDGHTIWHYRWRSRGGTHIGNRGLGMWHNYLFVETPDNYLISLDARTGKERWHKEIASFDEQYFSTPAPVVVGDHVLVGTGNDMDMPGFLQSFDPETGERQWKFYTVPMTKDDPALSTWKDLEAASHGGGNAWVNGSYDPETNLYIIGTGNPSPSYFAGARGNKEALYTCSLVAINVSTGKLKWYYQTSPNDTHDWDSAQTPILAEIMFKGRPRKVVMTAARNGYFFVVDRVTGAHLLTSQFSDTVNWAEKKLNAKGQPVRIPEKDHLPGGALVSSANQGASNWMPPSYSPDYGLFYVPVSESWAMYYTEELDPRGAMGLGGKAELPLTGTNFLKAIDPKTGKIAWSVKYPGAGFGSSGVLTTAGRLLFGGDIAGNFVARDPGNGKPLWHARIGTVGNAPQTYMLDGKQYVIVAAGDTLYAYFGG